MRRVRTDAELPAGLSGEAGGTESISPSRRSRKRCREPRRCRRTPTDCALGTARSAGGRTEVQEDLGAVGSPGAPSAVGLSLDAEAVVDLGVVPLAQQRGVLEVGLAAVDPGQHVVDVAPVARGFAAGEDALL